MKTRTLAKKKTKKKFSAHTLKSQRCPLEQVKKHFLKARTFWSSSEATVQLGDMVIMTHHCCKNSQQAWDSPGRTHLLQHSLLTCRCSAQLELCFHSDYF